MKVSVALCTYNGERYIEEQLSSILNQSKKVDEVIVCDDRSTDKTVEIVKNISESNKDVDIRIYENVQNIGFYVNFNKAVSLCQGDIIFLSDQDDVWNPEKVRIVVDWFEKNPDKSVVFTDADLIDAEGNIFNKGNTLWDYTGFPLKIQKEFDAGYSFEIIASKNRCTGATMALRRSFVFDFSMYREGCIFHDHIIAVAATFQNKLGYISDRLIQYRIHKDQTSGINFSADIVPDKYSVNSRGKQYIDMEMSLKMKGRLIFFVLRADIPKKAITKIYRYFSVYGLTGIAFWWHDLIRLIKYVVTKNK